MNSEFYFPFHRLFACDGSSPKVNSLGYDWVGNFFTGKLQNKNITTWNGDPALNKNWTLANIDLFESGDQISMSFYGKDVKTKRFKFFVPYIDCLEIEVHDKLMFVGTTSALNFYMLDPGMQINYRIHKERLLIYDCFNY